MKTSLPKKENTTVELINIHRNHNRYEYLEHIRKTIRFGWDVDHTRISPSHHLTQSQIQSQKHLVQLIDQLLQQSPVQCNNKLKQLTQIITQTNITQITTVTLRINELSQYLSSHLQYLQGITLVGNLALQFHEYLQAFIHYDIPVKVCKIMYQLRKNLDYALMYSWALSELTKQLTTNESGQIDKMLPLLYGTISQYQNNRQYKHQNHTHYKNILRVLSYITVCIQLPSQFMYLLMQQIYIDISAPIGTLKLQQSNEINRVHMFMIIVSQILLATHTTYESPQLSEKPPINQLIFWYLVMEYEHIPNKVRACHPNIYELFALLIENSDVLFIYSIISKDQQSTQLNINNFPNIITNYKYNDLAFLKLWQIILKSIQIDEHIISQLIYETSILDNMIHDINDNNAAIGYQCLLTLLDLTQQCREKGYTLQLQWMVAMGFKENVKSFTSDNWKSQKLCEVGESILDQLNNDY